MLFRSYHAEDNGGGDKRPKTGKPRWVNTFRSPSSGGASPSQRASPTPPGRTEPPHPPAAPPPDSAHQLPSPNPATNTHPAQPGIRRGLTVKGVRLARPQRRARLDHRRHRSGWLPTWPIWLPWAGVLAFVMLFGMEPRYVFPGKVAVVLCATWLVPSLGPVTSWGHATTRGFSEDLCR